MLHYNNPSCVTLRDFQEDIQLLAYIKRNLFRKIETHRLIINHLIILFNVFGDFAIYLLFYKIPQEYWGTLATYLLFLNRMKDEISLNGRCIRLSDLHLDQELITTLRKI